MGAAVRSSDHHAGRDARMVVVLVCLHGRCCCGEPLAGTTGNPVAIGTIDPIEVRYHSDVTRQHRFTGRKVLQNTFMTQTL